jgi:magnesium chelatase subunit I
MSVFYNFPFAAIIGQEEMKLALQLNVIDPKIGGVMIMGERGTGKSTTIRALAELLPEISKVKGDPFNSFPPKSSSLQDIELIRVPMVEIPLGVTEDKVCGTINIKEILSGGEGIFEPGLLARANRGLLYVDEINLLDNHIVDILLDSAASGWNTVEREDISMKHPANFIMIGSANPEEGELRPQLLDRFGMLVEVKTVKDPILRVRIVEERLSFDNSPMDWLTKYAAIQSEMSVKIARAQKLLSTIDIKDDYKLKISQICSELGVEGLRGDIVSIRAAKAHAAFYNRVIVEKDDIKKTISFCLRHRLRKDPLDPISSSQKIDSLVEKYFFME